MGRQYVAARPAARQQIETVEAALRALGKRLEVSVRAMA
jgi:hypothetical protein